MSFIYGKKNGEPLTTTGNERCKKLIATFFECYRIILLYGKIEVHKLRPNNVKGFL